VNYDEADLPAALSVLETATLPGSTSHLLRGYALHRSYPMTAKPLASRAMQLIELHLMDSTTFEPADIEPYLLPPSAGDPVQKDPTAHSTGPVVRAVPT
jgi:hypothetical protein